MRLYTRELQSAEYHIAASAAGPNAIVRWPRTHITTEHYTVRITRGEVRLYGANALQLFSLGTVLRARSRERAVTSVLYAYSGGT